MKDQDKVGVVFVNTVVGRGLLNNVANLTFSTYNFSPAEDGIEADPVISCRLRMDIQCLRQLHESTGELLATLENKIPAALETSGVAPVVEDEEVVPTKRAKENRTKVN